MAQGSREGQNYTHGANPEVDALFDELLREPDLDVQAVLGNQIDAVLWQDLFTIPLFQEPILLAYDADLEASRTTSARSVRCGTPRPGPCGNGSTRWGGAVMTQWTGVHQPRL